MRQTLSAILLTCCVLTGAAPASLPTDFAPIAAFATGDGPAQPITMFHKGPGYVAFSVPDSWKVEKNREGVQFSKPAVAQASAYLAPAKDIPLQDPKKALAALRAAVLATVPPDASETLVTLEPQAAGNIQRWPVYVAEVGFTYYGSKFRRSVLLIDQQTEGQAQIIITATARDYDAVYKETRAILSSWWDVIPKDLPDIKFK